MEAEFAVLWLVLPEEVPEEVPEEELLPKALFPKAPVPKLEEEEELPVKLLPEDDDAEEEPVPKGSVKLDEEPAACDALNPDDAEEDDAEEELPNGSVKLLEPKAPVPKPEEDEDELPVKEELPKSASATDDMEVMPIISAQAAAVVMMSPLNFTKKSLQMVIRPLYHPQG